MVDETRSKKEAARRLKQARKGAGFEKATEAAEKFGWSYGTYKKHENGSNGYSKDDATKYARAYKVSVDWLLTGKGDPKQPPAQIPRVPIRVIPMMKAASFDSILAIAKGGYPNDPDGEIVIADTPDITPRAFAFQLEGNAMIARDPNGMTAQEPKSFLPGDHVVISPETSVEPEDFVLAIVGDKVVFRRYSPLNAEDDPPFQLIPLNKIFPVIATSTRDGAWIVGKAIKLIRDL